MFCGFIVSLFDFGPQVTNVCLNWTKVCLNWRVFLSNPLYYISTRVKVSIYYGVTVDGMCLTGRKLVFNTLCPVGATKCGH